MLSIARQFGSAADAAGADAPSADASKSAIVHAAARTVFMPSVPSLPAFARPGRLLAGPGWKRIPFRPAHPALLISDFHEDERCIVAACFGADEDRRNSISVPDDCRVCHFGLPFGLNWPRPGLQFARRMNLPLQNGRNRDHQNDEDRHQYRWYEPFTNFEFCGI